MADFVRGKIREVVSDPATADLLTPSTVIGCKRLCVDTGYYATFNRDDVRNELIDLDATRLNALRTHVPGAVWIILVVVAGCGCYVSGYGSGASGARSR